MRIVITKNLLYLYVLSYAMYFKKTIKKKTIILFSTFAKTINKKDPKINNKYTL